MFSTTSYIEVLKCPINERQTQLRNILENISDELSLLDENIASTAERIKELELQLPSDDDALLKKVIAGFRTCSDFNALLESLDLGLQRIESCFRSANISDRDAFRRLSFEVSFRLDAIRDLRQRCQYLYSAIQVSEEAAARATNPAEVETASWYQIADLFSCAVSRKPKGQKPALTNN